MDYLKDKKLALYKIIKPYFKDRGFKYISGIPTRFVREENTKFYKIGFDFKTKSDFHYVSPVRITFIQVENIIREIGEPNYNYDELKSLYSLSTVQKDFSASYEEKFAKLDLKTVEGFEQWGHLILEYMEGEGKAFMEHYSYLPNVLKEMDRLEAEGKYWNEILVGLADYDFRGLIISKLCNDPNFNEKIRSRDEVFYNVPQLKEWVPYYEKLKERLKTVEPIYNNG